MSKGVALNQNLIEYVQNLDEKTHAEIPLATLMTLLEEKPVVDSGRLLPPVSKVVSSAEYKCSVSQGGDVLEVDVNLDVYTFQTSAEWTIIPLFSRSVPLSNVEVHRVATKGCEDEVAELSDDPQKRDAQGWLGSSPKYPAHTSLFTVEGGRYNVTATMSVALKGKRAAEFVVPKAAESTVEFVAPVRGAQIRIPNTVTLDTGITADGLPKKVAVINSNSSRVNVEWTEGIVEAPPAVEGDADGDLSDVEVAPEPVVSAYQQCLVTLGDGLLTLNSNITYTLVNARRDAVYLELPADEGVRVLAVEGPNVAGFKVVGPSREGPPTAGAGGDDGALALDEDAGAVVPPPPPYNTSSDSRRLEVTLRYPAESTVKLAVMVELEYSSKGTAWVPFIKCADTSREKKHIAVGVRTSVEVEELSSSGLSPLDRTELGPALSSKSVLLGYLALSRSPELTLKLTKHEDVGVMIAVVDRALFTVSQTAHGKRIVKLNMRVRNTTLQYMAVALGKNASIWSLVVDGAPTKPARNAKGNIMLPLRKSGRGANCFDVELVYVTDVGSMGGGADGKKKKGVLALTLPALSLEVTAWQCLFTVPSAAEGFKYGEVKGDMRPQPNTYNLMEFSGNGSTVVHQQEQQAPRRHRRRDSFSGGLSLSSTNSYRSKSKKKAGHVPVRVQMPTSTGAKHFLFDKSLILNRSLSVEIPYTYTPPKPLKHK